jgi:hypothetical protein
MAERTVAGWVRQLIVPWLVCALAIPYLLYWGAWIQAIVVASVAIVGTVVTRRRHRIPTVSPTTSLQYSRRRAPTQIDEDAARPLVGLVRQKDGVRYVWLIPRLPDGEWGYLWSGEKGRGRSARPAAETVTADPIDYLAASWDLRVLPQDTYSDEVWRLHFGRRGAPRFSPDPGVSS